MSTMKIVGYVAFFVGVFMLSLYWTFPWDAAKERALTVASAQTGLQIEADDVGPSWGTGIVARGVRIRPRPAADPIELSELTARAHLLPLLSGGRGVSIDFPIARGEVDASIVQSGEVLALEGAATNLELALIQGLKDATGLPLGGILSLTVDLELGTKDPKRSEGEIAIVGRGLEILKGGKLSGFPVPALVIGDMSWTVPIKEGVATLDNQEIKGESIELVLDGQVTLDKVPREAASTSPCASNRPPRSSNGSRCSARCSTTSAARKARTVFTDTVSPEPFRVHAFARANERHVARARGGRRPFCRRTGSGGRADAHRLRERRSHPTG